MSEEKEGKTTFYNTTDSPVLMDAYGRTLGGRERGEFPETPATRRGVELESLIELESDKDEGDSTDFEAEAKDTGEEPKSSRVKKQTADKTRN